MAKLGPTIVFERLTHRSRQLRVKWHNDAKHLLANRLWGQYLDGLERVVRQLGAIETAVAALPMPKQYEFVRGGFGVSAAVTAKPTRGGDS